MTNSSPHKRAQSLPFEYPGQPVSKPFQDTVTDLMPKRSLMFLKVVKIDHRKYKTFAGRYDYQSHPEPCDRMTAIGNFVSGSVSRCCSACCKLDLQALDLSG